MPDTSAERAQEAEPLAFRAVRGGLWVALSSYFNVGFGFLANLILTRILAPEHFGVFALAGFFFSLLNIRTKFGVGYAFAQRKEIAGELVGTHLVLDVTAGLATLLIAGIALPVLRAFGYSADVAWVVLALAGIGVADAVTATAGVLLDKELRFGQNSLVRSLGFALSYLPAFWLALRGAGYWSLVAQNALYALLLLAGLWWVARRQLPQVWHLEWRFERRVAGEFVRFGGIVGLATLAGMLLTQFDNFLVGTFVGVATLGLYDRAYRIAQWPSLLISSVVTRTAFYTYARLQDDAVRLRKTVAMTLWLISFLALPLALAIFIAGPDLVALLYGQRWLPSALFLRFLVVYSLLRPVLDNAGSLFVAVGRPQRTTLVMAAQAAALMVIATPLTLAYGAVGTCVGVGIAFALGLVLTYHYVRQTVALSLRDSFAGPAVAALATVAIYLLLVRSLGVNLLPLPMRVLVKGAYGAGMFLLLTLLLQPGTTIERVGYVWRLVRRVEERGAAPALESGAPG